MASQDQTSDEPLFHLRALRYLYNGRHVVLDGLALDIRRGEQIALLAANGCGVFDIPVRVDKHMRQVDAAQTAGWHPRTLRGEEHRVVADGSPATILGDCDLLIRANLIHAYLREMVPDIPRPAD